LPTDPAWAYFQVQAPASGPTKPTLTEPASPDSSSASTCDSGPGHDAQGCAAYSDALTQYQADQDAYESAWAHYQQELATWQTQTDERYEALDTAIESYNHGFAGAVIRSWTQYNIMRTIIESQVASSVPGQILSGLSMSLKGSELVNDKSRIVVGGQLTGDLNRLSNVQALGQHVVHEQGTAQSTWSRWRGGVKRYHQRDWSGVSVYAPPDVVTSITLSVAETLQNTRPTGSGTAVNDRQSVGELSKASAVNNPNNSGSSLAMTSAPALVVPNSSLFKVDPQSNARFLIETDPRFANYRQWLSSDYLLTASGFKPEDTQKRLGDGFYEQKLIREQVAALTGYRFLGDYRSDEAQYTALMAAGATFAQAHQLRPGIALSGAQVAQLTSDIVWLVRRDVQLPDGRTTTALVPQVYLSPRSGDLAANGALFGGAQNTGSLISARSIELALSGDLSNSGTVAGRQLLDINAKNIENTGLLRGDVALLQAEEDIDVIGGQVVAHRGLSVQAGEDFTLASTTQGGSTKAGSNRFSQQGVDRVAGLYVSGPAGVLLAQAGNNMTLTAAQVNNAGSGVTQLQAGNDFTLATVNVENSHDITWNANNYHRQSSSAEVGTQISGGGAVNLVAQDDVSMRAAQVEAAGRLSIKSETGNVVIEAGERRESLDTSRQTIRRGTLSKTTTTTRTQMSSTQAQRSTISGQGLEVLGESVVSVGTVFDSQGGELHVEGQDKTLLYEARDTRSEKTQVDVRRKGVAGLEIVLDKKSSETTKAQSSATVVTELKSDQAVRIGVGALADLLGAKVTAPKIEFERAAGADPSTAGVLRLDAAIDQSSSSVESKVETAKLWQKQEGSGRMEQTAVMTQLDGAVTFAEGLQIVVDVPQVQTQAQPLTGANLQRQIEQLSGQSGLEYLQQLQNNPAVKFIEVKLAVDSWSYKQQGLTEAGAALVAIAVAVATGGAGAGLVGTTTATATGTVTTLGGMTLATTTAATATAAATATTFAAGAAVNAGFAALASQAAVSLANNGGDLGQTLKDMSDKDTVKNILIAMGTAGVGAGQGVSAVAAQTLTGCVAGEVSGAGCESGAKTAVVLSGAGEAYRALVGYAANAVPGENRNGTKLDGTSTGDGSYEFIDHAGPNFGQQQPSDHGMNVIGLNKLGSLLSQGGTVSRALNQVPFVNATAGIHDYIFNANPDLNFTLWNVPTMLPAAALAIPASLNNPNIFWLTQIKQPSTDIKSPAPPSIIRVDNPLPRPTAKTTEAAR
jgi:large exoprotein involved in heme utilization and adhesion